jgi:hypothetical protein
VASRVTPLCFDLGSFGFGDAADPFYEMLVLCFDVELSQVGDRSHTFDDGGARRSIINCWPHVFEVVIVFGLVLEVDESF